MSNSANTTQITHLTPGSRFVCLVELGGKSTSPQPQTKKVDAWVRVE